MNYFCKFGVHNKKYFKNEKTQLRPIAFFYLHLIFM